jgi:hypothetical protein
VKIDKKVEPAVREALASSVAGERERFDTATTTIAQSGDDFVNRALALVFAIDATALYSIHDGQRPSDEQLDFLSREFTRQEDWTDVDAVTALTYLTALADTRPPLDALSLPDVFFTSFAVGGWLLSAFVPNDLKWTDFLDTILDKIESDHYE